MLEQGIIDSDRGTRGIRPHLIVANLFQRVMGQLVDFIDEAPCLFFASIHSICCRVGHWFLTKKVVLLLGLRGYLLSNGLLSVGSLTVVSPPVSS